MSETLIATTNRPVTFIYQHPQSRLVIDTQRMPAGMEVYVQQSRKGLYEIRMPGSLCTQWVALKDLDIP